MKKAVLILSVMLLALLLPRSFALSMDAGSAMQQIMHDQMSGKSSPDRVRPLFEPNLIEVKRVPNSRSLEELAGNDTPEKLYSNALYYYVKKDYLEVIKHLNKALEQKPDMSKAYLLRGTSYFYVHNYTASFRDADRSVALMPQSKDAYNLRSVNNLFLNKTYNAIQDCQHVIEIDSLNFFAHAVCSVGYTIGKQPKIALEHAKQAVKWNQMSPIAHFARGYISLELGDYEQALADSNYIIKIRPEAALAYTLRAYAKLKQKPAFNPGNEVDMAEVIADANRSIQLSPNLPFNYTLLGSAYQAEHKEELANKNLKEAIRLYEKNGNTEKAQSVKDFMDMVNNTKSK